MIWSTLLKGLKSDPDIPFILERDNFGTIDGYSEGYFAVLASNFIANRSLTTCSSWKILCSYPVCALSPLSSSHFI